jgi:uncharacterized membrane protein YhiD involved in acid resistance
MKRSILNLLLALSVLLIVFCNNEVYAGQQRITKTPKKVKVNKYKTAEVEEEKPKEKKELSQEIQKKIKAAEEAKLAMEKEKEEKNASKKKVEKEIKVEAQRKEGVNRKGRKSPKFIHDPADGSIISLDGS